MRRTSRTSPRVGKARRPFALGLEKLETRLTPANVDVLSGHYDQLLSGQNLGEQVLHPGPAGDPTALNATNFGTLFSSPIDGQAYAQPLYKADLTLPDGSTHNVAFIATEHDSVYAFDADNGTQLWHDSFIDPAHGITTIPYAELSTPDLYPEIGITATPVIDPDTSTLYVVVKTKEIRNDGGVHYVWKLHALDLTDGSDKFGGPYQIGDTHVASAGANPVFANETTAIMVHGSGGESSGGANPLVAFSAERENERMSMELIGNIVYTSWASHADFRPYHGWVIGFDKTTLQPVKVFNTAPNADGVGIWESGGGLSWDGSYLYFAVGNGFGSNAYNPAQGNYSESVIKLDPTPNWDPSTLQMMTVADYFTPNNWQQLDQQDADLGSGGVMLLPDSVGSSTHPHLMVETGKQGRIYLIDRDNMGQFNSGFDNVVQTVTAGQAGVWGNPAYAQINDTTGIIYYHGSGDVLKGYFVSNGHIDTGNILHSTFSSHFPGEQPSISADGTSDPNNPVNGIVWELQVDNAAGRIQGVGDNTTAGPAILRAFSTTNLSTPLYDSSSTGQRDFFGGSVKFTFPVVTNGQVLVGTADHFSVLGLFPAAVAAPDAPSSLTAQVQSSAQGTQIVLNWTNPDPNPGADPTGIKILRSTDGVNFTLYDTVNRNATTYTDAGPLVVGESYYYEVVATNQAGDSPASNVASAAVPISAAVLTLTGTGASTIGLSWTNVTDGYYNIERSTDGVNFTAVATVPAPLTTYSDSGLTLGQYDYRIHAYTADSSSDSLSNALGAWVGPTIDHSTPENGAFTQVGDLTANGSTEINSAAAPAVIRLTNAAGVTGSAFSNTRITAGSFTTTFDVRLHEGSQPNYADGFVFVLQANNPTALGQGTSGIGYQGIGHSVAIYFSTFRHTGDPSGSSTGVVVNGAAPHGGVDTTPSGVLLTSQDIKQITLTYDGTILTEQITDVLTGQTFTHMFTVNIPQALGSDTAYVGFTGASGSSGFWELEDILSWQFTSQVALPGAPSNLRQTGFASAAVDLAWNGNSYNENYFQVERSSDGVNFVPIATTTGLTFEDSGLAAGTYYYRVTAINDAGNSAYTGTLQVSLPGPLLTTHQDIGTAGDPSVPGNATFANGTYTVTGSGSDVWNNADHFQYLYQQFLGDGEIVVRLMTEQSGVNDFAKAGVMFRQSLSADSQNAYMLEFPNGSRGFPTYQWRATSGAATADHQQTNGPRAPVWLRLVRSGNLFTGYWATDTGGGTHGVWNQLGSETVVMSPDVYVGLAVTSHQNGQTVTATFDHLQIIPAVLQVSHFDVTASARTVGSGTAFDITVTALDPFYNVVTGYSGTVHFSTSDPDPGVMLPADYTFQPSDAGVATFPGQAVLITPGDQTITVNDTTYGVLAGSTTVTVTGGPAPHGHSGRQGAPVTWWVSATPAPTGASTPPQRTQEAQGSFQTSIFDLRPSSFVVGTNADGQNTKVQGRTTEFLDRIFGNEPGWLLGDPLGEVL